MVATGPAFARLFRFIAPPSTDGAHLARAARRRQVPSDRASHLLVSEFLESFGKSVLAVLRVADFSRRRLSLQQPPLFCAGAFLPPPPNTGGRAVSTHVETPREDTDIARRPFAPHEPASFARNSAESDERVAPRAAHVVVHHSQR